jgi:hypothetical protein
VGLLKGDIAAIRLVEVVANKKSLNPRLLELTRVLVT